MKKIFAAPQVHYILQVQKEHFPVTRGHFANLLSRTQTNESQTAEKRNLTLLALMSRVGISHFKGSLVMP